MPGALSATVLPMAEPIQRLACEPVVMAFERLLGLLGLMGLMGLMGLILVAISVETLIQGIKQLAHPL